MRRKIRLFNGGNNFSIWKSTTILVFMLKCFQAENAVLWQCISVHCKKQKKRDALSSVCWCHFFSWWLNWVTFLLDSPDSKVWNDYRLLSRIWLWTLCEESVCKYVCGCLNDLNPICKLVSFHFPDSQAGRWWWVNAFANLEQLSAASYWGPAKPQQTHLQIWGLFDAFKNYQN